MRFQNETMAIARSERVYSWLLMIYPAVFRQAYGYAMRQVFRDRCRDAYGREQMWGLIKTWLGVALDLGKSACVEHISNLKGRPSMPSPSVPNYRRRWATAAFFLACAITWAIHWFQPSFYASTGRIVVYRAQPQPLDNAEAHYRVSDPYFLQTEIEKLTSKTVASRVINEQQLIRTWTEREFLPDKFKFEQAYQTFRNRVKVRNIPNSSMIEVQALDEDKNVAARIANGVIEAYRTLRLEQSQQATRQGLARLEAELDKADSKVTESTVKVQAMRETLTEVDAQGELSAERLRTLEAQVMSVETEHRQLAAQYERFQGMEPRELVNILPVVVPDSVLSDMLLRRGQAETELVAAETAYGSEHPEVKKAKAVLSQIQSSVSERQTSILAGLKFKLEALNRESELRRNAWWEAKKNDAETAAKYGAYALAKKDLESARETRKTLALKISQEQAGLALQAESGVEFVDQAEPGLRPVILNLPLKIMRGLFWGGVASLTTALFFTLKKPGASGASPTPV
jgi:uncharacterized protein involved in exopolysaccharide biosynthesis